ncbi:hypothetical protein MMC31_006452, partial [Peltigera leucophlebia]|nr:hypothetical protein [Peltigera leucophlebia]
MAVHDIVIVGANFAGIGTAHYLLRHTVPALETRNKSTTYRVILISPSTHFFWKIGAPRTLINDKLIPLDKAFVPIADGFKEYSAEKFTLVLGTATALDENRKTITIKPVAPSTTTSVSYSSIIVATGTTSASPLWTLHGSHEESIAAFKQLHKSLPEASTILIAGGGPAGTETAGEIGYNYPKAELTILSGSKHLLPRLTPSIGAAAESKLAAFGVKTIHNVRVVSATPNGKKTTLELSDNTVQIVDIYIDATGGRPNSDFLPASWLDDKGKVITDHKTLRGPVTGVYAVGDVASYSSGGILDVLNGVRPLCSSIQIDLSASSQGAAETKQQ